MFKITKIASGRGILEATSIGTIFEDEGKTKVKVSIRPAVCSIVFSIILLLFLVSVIIFLNSLGLMDVKMNFVLIFFLFVFTMIPIFSYDEEKEKSKKKLLEIFK